MPGVTLGPPYKNRDMHICGGVYRRLIWYRGRPIGWLSYGCDRDPLKVVLWLQEYVGVNPRDVITYETEGAALQVAQAHADKIGEP